MEKTKKKQSGTLPYTFLLVAVAVVVVVVVVGVLWRVWTHSLTVLLMSYLRKNSDFHCPNGCRQAVNYGLVNQ